MVFAFLHRFPRMLAVTSLVGSAVLMSSSSTPVFNRRDKAFFADPQIVNFVRPGLVIKITGASIAQDGTVNVNFTITDPKGLALDRAGVNTPGPVSTSFLVAYLPNNQNQYVNYITRTASSTVTNITTQQPTADSGGTYTPTASGFTYTFKNKLPSGFDASATHTVGVYGSRDLSEFDLGTYYNDDVFSFVPSGSAVTHIHDEIRTQTCNKCHDPLAAHGGPRRSIPLCVLCHEPQLVDPDTGNSVDMKVFIHKIHMGEQLPSVVAGHPYQIIGFQQSVNDYSTVVFPADVRNCTFCHEGSLAPPPDSGQPGQGGKGAPAVALATKTGAPPPENGGDTTGTGTALLNPPGAACGSSGNPGCNTDLLPWPPTEKDRWLNTPTRVTCGSCHDEVNFATGENHANLPQFTDNQCTTCHQIQGETPFDISILGAHTIPQFAPGLPGVVFKLDKVDNGGAGQSPTVTFEIHDKSGNPILPSQMNFLNLVMAGPTSDYTNAISESATGASGSGGTYTYTFKATVPSGATGAYTIGIEGYKNATLLAGTTIQTVVRDVGFNQLIDFSVDGSPVTPHTQDNTQAQCNECHFALSLHGTIRQNVQYCLLCHNPTATDSSQRPASANPPQTIDLPVMIHRIHTGDTAEAAGQLTPFVIYGFNHSVNDFSDVRFPAQLNHCEKCHVNETDEPPVPDGRIAVNSPRAFINPTPPTTAACTACHTAKDSSAHAAVMTSPTLGESCGVCHGPGAEFAVDKVHADTQ